MKSKDLLKRLRALGETIKDDEELLEADVAEILVLDQGLQVKRVKTEKDFSKRQLREASTQPTLPRAPVVCVMGHVDHGKTSLLDALRKTNVAAGEAGGITQRLAAFSVDMNNFVEDAEPTANRRVVFLDTPGHAAFSAMRAHGAHATDIACIIVAAVEGVQPQTIESINFAKEGGASIVVAISKIDRIPEEQRPATIAKIKAQLADLGVVSEDFGGEVPVVAISSVTGYGLQELVEQLLLQAEMLELQAVQEGAAQSVVLDTNTEKGVGFVADVLVQWGKLRVGDVFVVGNAYGRVRQITDAFGNQITEALPSTPVRITGLKSLPDAGEELLVVEDEGRARDIAARRSRLAQMRQMRERQAQNGVDEDSPSLHVMLKADTHGTMDALHQIVTGINDPEIQIKIVGQGIGPITRSDIQMAMLANRCPIMCFNVGFGDTNTKNFAKEEDVPCSTHNIIYRIEDEIKNMILAKLPKVPILEKKVSLLLRCVAVLWWSMILASQCCVRQHRALRVSSKYSD
jgi:translation initiation factor IF-2